MSQASYAENGEGYILERETMVWFWDTYCPDATQRQEADAAPMLASDHSNLPPALIVTAEFDPLRDEGEAYADLLTAAGNDARAVRYDGLVHDFFATASMFQSSRAGFEATARVLQDYLN